MFMHFLPVTATYGEFAYSVTTNCVVIFMRLEICHCDWLCTFRIMQYAGRICICSVLRSTYPTMHLVLYGSSSLIKPIYS